MKTDLSKYSDDLLWKAVDMCFHLDDNQLWIKEGNGLLSGEARVNILTCGYSVSIQFLCTVYYYKLFNTTHELLHDGYYVAYDSLETVVPELLGYLGFGDAEYTYEVLSSKSKT